MQPTHPDEAILAFAKQAFIEKVPFHQVLGLSFHSSDLHPWAIRIDKKPELIGNYLTGILHGGVIASVLDSVAGMSVALSLFAKLSDLPFEQKKAIFMKMATVDMRVDFLRPANGDFFIATARTLKCGKKVSSTQMELHDNRSRLVAVGSAAFLHTF